MGELNILFTMLCRNFHEQVVKELDDRIKIGHKIAVTELYQGNVELFDSTYECGDVYRAYYKKYKEYHNCPPVDENLIGQMQPYDMEVLKMMDRHQSWKWNFEERMQAYYEHIRFWDYILDQYDINHVVFFNVPHEVFDYIIYRLCKVKGIRTLVFMIAPLFPDRSILSHDFLTEKNRFSDYLEKYQDISKKEELDIEKNYKQRFTEYLSAAKENDEEKALKIRKWSGSKRSETIDYMSFMDVRQWMETWYKEKDTKEVQALYHKLYIRVFLKGIREVSRFANTMKTLDLWRYYERFSETPDKREKYVYFALHYQPEATSAPMGGGIFSNQLIAIKMLSYCIPRDYKLYVKEHPAQSHIGKCKSLYRRIAAIPNVKIISSKVNQYFLIRNAVATASLTGTIAIESVMSGVPCILFGKELYNSMEGVYAVRNNTECRKAVEDIISGSHFIDRNKIELFFKAIVGYSNDINVGYGDYDEKINAHKMAEVLIRNIQMDRDRGGFYA